MKSENTPGVYQKLIWVKLTVSLRDYTKVVNFHLLIIFVIFLVNAQRLLSIQAYFVQVILFQKGKNCLFQKKIINSK